MNHNRNRILTMALAACMFTGAGSVAAAQAAGSAGVDFVSGGVGLIARQEMQSHAGQYNLHVEFAAAPEGEYVSDVDVSIVNSRGANLLSTRTQGPWLMARLPAGTYTVNARYGGSTRQQQVTVGGGRKHLVMRFPQSREQVAGGTGY
jgi:hypothetical protein